LVEDIGCVVNPHENLSLFCDSFSPLDLIDEYFSDRIFNSWNSVLNIKMSEMMESRKHLFPVHFNFSHFKAGQGGVFLKIYEILKMNNIKI
jgi:hypothetical protein